MRLSFVDPHLSRSTLSLQKEQTAYKSLRSKCFAVINFGMGLFDLQRKLLIFYQQSVAPNTKQSHFSFYLHAVYIDLLRRVSEHSHTSCTPTLMERVNLSIKPERSKYDELFGNVKISFFLVEGNASCISVIIVELKKNLQLSTFGGEQNIFNTN